MGRGKRFIMSGWVLFGRLLPLLQPVPRLPCLALGATPPATACLCRWPLSLPSRACWAPRGMVTTTQGQAACSHTRWGGGEAGRGLKLGFMWLVRAGQGLELGFMCVVRAGQGLELGFMCVVRAGSEPGIHLPRTPVCTHATTTCVHMQVRRHLHWRLQNLAGPRFSLRSMRLTTAWSPSTRQVCYRGHRPGC